MRRTLLGFVGGVIACALLFRTLPRAERRGETVADTVRVTLTDTVRIARPVTRDSVVIRYVTARLPVVRDTVHVIAREECDSAEVEIPVMRKRYADSTYTAWVSGYNPSLDSIHVYPRHEVVTITNTVRRKPKRWSVGLSAGYGMTPKGFQPYVGAGVTWRPW